MADYDPFKTNIDPETVAIGEWTPPVQVSDYKATLQADFAALARQTGEQWEQDYAAAKAGANPVRDPADRFAGEILNRPAGQLIDPDDPEGSVGQLVEAVERPGSARVQQTIQGRAQTLPMVQENDPAELEYREVKDNGGFFNLAEYTEAPDMLLEAVRAKHTGEHYANSNWETGVEFLWELAPGKGLNDYRAVVEAAVEEGILDDGDFNYIFGSAFGGATQEKIRERIGELGGSPQGRAALADRFLTTLQKKMDYFGVENSALAKAMLAEEIITDEFIKNGDTKSRFDFVSNIFSVLSALELGFVAKGVKLAIHSGRRLPPLFKAAQIGNPKRAQMMLSEAIANTPDSVLHKNYGTIRADLAETQLPRNPLVDDLVDVPKAEAQRLAGIDEGISQSLRNLRANLSTVKERATILEDDAKKIMRAHGGRIRPGMSRLITSEDGTLARFETVVGKDEAHAFSSLREATEYAKRFEGEDVVILKKQKDGSVKPFEAVPRYRSSPRGRHGKGQYFVQINQERRTSVFDRLLWDDSPVEAGSWLGRAASAVNVPSSWLRTGIMQAATNAKLGEQYLRQQLDSYLAPMFRLKSKELEQVSAMMLHAQTFGIENGRNITRKELEAAFADSPKRAIDGFFTTRYYNDKLHQINNHTLWVRRQNEGYKTIGRGEGAYHGPVIAPENLRDAKRLYDPVTQQGVDVTPELIERLARKKQKIIRVDDKDIVKGKGEKFNYIITNSERGYGLRNLDYNQLPYIPGYFPRFYADQHAIIRNIDNAIVNGNSVRQSETLFMSPTAREADERIAKLIDDEGRQLYGKKWDSSWDNATKVQRLKAKGVSFEKSQDLRLLDQDRTGQDVTRFNTEGRVFFDARLDKPLNNIYGEEAAILDPVNTLQRSSQMVARQVAFEEQIANWMGQFKLHFGPRLGDKMPKIEGRATANVLSDLRELAAQGGDTGKAAREAAIFWRYLMQMQGQMGGGAKLFRRQAIEASEWADETLRKAGGKGLSPDTKDALGSFNIMDQPKKLAFFALLVTRPGRQLLLQSLQSANLQALDLAYAGRWQWDTLSLISRVKRLGSAKEGRGIKTFKDKINAKMLGYTDEETDILVREFESSGLIQQVDVHSYASGMPKHQAQLRHGGTRVWDEVAGPGRAVANVARKYGFDLGEQINVTASWLMALRRHMKENGLKSPKNLTRDDWLTVNNRGIQYAQNMNTSNAAVWQHGALGVPLQFLQFTHKWVLMTWLNALGLGKAGLGNLQVTQKESLKMMAGQLVLFGGAGTVFLQDEIKALVHDPEGDLADLPDFAKNMMTDGLLDTAFDYLGRIAIDPDYNLATPSSFSPNAGLRQLGEMYYESIFEKPMIETLMGPGLEVGSRMMQGAQTAYRIAFGGGYDHLTPNQRANAIAANLVGPWASGISDLTKANIMLKEGQILNSSYQALDPKGELQADFNVGDWINRVLLGANSQKIDDFWKLQNDKQAAFDTRRRDIKEAAKELHKVLHQAGGVTDMQELASVARMAGLVIANWESDPRWTDALAMEDFQEAYKNISDGRSSIIDDLSKAFLNGDVTRDLINTITYNTVLTPEQKDIMLKFGESQRNMSNQYFEEAAQANIELGSVYGERK